MITSPLNVATEKTHEAVLVHLKRNGEMTVGQLCQALAITAMAVRRHLAGLQRDGLVASRLVRQGRGRPFYRYHLTEKANKDLFPSGALNLAQDLLDAAFAESGAQGVMDLLALRQNYLAKKLQQRLAGKNLPQRVAEVAKIFCENGFMTEWEALPDGNYLIFQRHCAVHNLANQYRQLCVLEPKLIETLLGTQVTRKQYMLNNDPVCSYLVQATESAATKNTH